ncbi:MAG: protein kinase [Pseudomonadota bacterium]
MSSFKNREKRVVEEYSDEEREIVGPPVQKKRICKAGGKKMRQNIIALRDLMISEGSGSIPIAKKTYKRPQKTQPGEEAYRICAKCKKKYSHRRFGQHKCKPRPKAFEGIHVPCSTSSVLMDKKKLASGSYGEVHLGIRRGKEVAVKIVMNPSDLVREKKGMKLGKRVPNFVQELDEAKNAIIMEMAGIDIKKFIRGTGKLTVRTIGSIMFQILTFLSAAHRKGLHYRDLKPGNILINESLNVTVCDPGSIRKFDPSSTKTRVVQYTPIYLAPELEVKFYLQIWSPASDIWAAGCTFVELFYRRPMMNQTRPYRGCALSWKRPTLRDLEFIDGLKKDLLETEAYTEFKKSLPKIPHADINKYFAEYKNDKDFKKWKNEIISLIDKMLNWNARSRISAKAALASPFIKAHKPVT